MILRNVITLCLVFIAFGAIKSLGVDLPSVMDPHLSCTGITDDSKLTVELFSGATSLSAKELKDEPGIILFDRTDLTVEPNEHFRGLLTDVQINTRLTDSGPGSFVMEAKFGYDKKGLMTAGVATLSPGHNSFSIKTNETGAKKTPLQCKVVTRELKR